MYYKNERPINPDFGLIMRMVKQIKDSVGEAPANKAQIDENKKNIVDIKQSQSVLRNDMSKMQKSMTDLTGKVTASEGNIENLHKEVDEIKVANRLPQFAKSSLQVAFKEDNPNGIMPFCICNDGIRGGLAYISDNKGDHCYIGNLNADKCTIKDAHPIKSKHANDVTYDPTRKWFFIADMSTSASGAGRLLAVDASDYSVKPAVLLPINIEATAVSFNPNDNTFWVFGGVSEGAAICHLSRDFRLLKKTVVDSKIYHKEAFTQGSFMYENEFVVVFNSFSAGKSVIGTQLYTFDNETGKVNGYFNALPLRGELEGGYWDGNELRMCSYNGDIGSYSVYCYSLEAPTFASGEEDYLFVKSGCNGVGTPGDPAGCVTQGIMLAQWLNSYIRIRLMSDITDRFGATFIGTGSVCFDVLPDKGEVTRTLKGGLYIHNATAKFARIKLDGEFRFDNCRTSFVECESIVHGGAPSVRTNAGVLTAIKHKYVAEGQWSICFQPQEGTICYIQMASIKSTYNSAYVVTNHGFCAYSLSANTLSDPVHDYDDGMSLNKAQ